MFSLFSNTSLDQVPYNPNLGMLLSLLDGAKRTQIADGRQSIMLLQVDTLGFIFGDHVRGNYRLHSKGSCIEVVVTGVSPYLEAGWL